MSDTLNKIERTLTNWNYA